MKRPCVTAGDLLRALQAALPAVLLGALVGGCATSAPQSVFRPATELAAQISDLLSFIIAIAVGVFIVVESLLIWAIVRFRARAKQGRPPQVHGNTRLEVAWTIAPAIILAVIAVPTITLVFKTYSSAPPDALQVRVVGHQWWWEIRYPDLNVVTANEIHVPAGRPVRYLLESADVIHSFWVPRLAGKRDLIPNRTNELWFTVDNPDVYDGQCAEFCGVQHANMRFKVFVEPAQTFDAWVRAQQAPPVAPVGLAAQGLTAFSQGACAGCHTIEGVSKGAVGPNLTHMGSRTTLAANTLDNTPDDLARWLIDPAAAKPGNKMPKLGLSPQQVGALVAYLESLK